MQHPLDWVLAGLAATAAGGINAVAGGGTLVSFPALLALGVPPVSANITNTVALCPGYLGGALAQRPGPGGTAPAGAPAPARGRLRWTGRLDPPGHHQRQAVQGPHPLADPAGHLLLALQDRLRRWLRIGAPVTSTGAPQPAHDPTWLPAPVFLTAIYGGYFGAGLGIMLLAVLGLVLHEPLNRLNALKQVLSLVINVVAALFFVFTGKVLWGFALAMAFGSLVGGHFGGRLAGWLDPKTLRAVVVVFGLAVSAYYFIT